MAIREADLAAVDEGAGALGEERLQLCQSRAELCETAGFHGGQILAQEEWEDVLAVLDEFGGQPAGVHEGQDFGEDSVTPDLVCGIFRALAQLSERVDDYVDDGGGVGVDIFAYCEEGNAAVGDFQGLEVWTWKDDGLVALLEGDAGGFEDELGLLAVWREVWRLC